MAHLTHLAHLTLRFNLPLARNSPHHSRISGWTTKNMRNNFTIPRASTARAGIATLEFAMALPFLLLLMVGITWLGFSVVTRTEVLVEARTKVWKQRFDNPKQEPLL